jgi:hypothetical protein
MRKGDLVLCGYFTFTLEEPGRGCPNPAEYYLIAPDGSRSGGECTVHAAILVEECAERYKEFWDLEPIVTDEESAK